MKSAERYGYFVKRVADWQEVWGLWNNGWALLGDDNNEDCFPVWPHPELAALYVTGDWAGYTPKSIEVHEWVEKWLPDLGREGRRIAVFPVEGQTCSIANSDRLKHDIEEELDKME